MVADAVVPVCLRLWRFAVPACSGVVPLGRAGTKFEIASSAIFLLVNEFITGQDLIVDGGNWLMSPMVRTPNPLAVDLCQRALLFWPAHNPPLRLRGPFPFPPHTAGGAAGDGVSDLEGGRKGVTGNGAGGAAEQQSEAVNN
jgi:hypothetical protein